MSRTMRLVGCRLAFLIFAVLPTGLVAGMVVQRCWPGGAARLARELSLATNLRVKCQEVRFPLPGVSVVRGLELADPETGELLARCRVLEIHQHSAGYSLLASQAEVQALGLATLSARMHQCVLQADAALVPGVQLSAAEVILASPERSETLGNLRLTCDASAVGPQVTLRFERLAGAGYEPCELKFSRNRQVAPPVTRCELATGAQGLPVALAQHVWPGLAQLGPAAEFSGAAWGTFTAHGWSGEMRGVWQQVDLNELVSQRFPHQITGTARIEIERSRLVQGALQEAVGHVTAGPGAMGHSLLAAAGEHLRLEMGTQVVNAEGGLFPYRQLGIQFSLADDTLELRGICEKWPGALVADDRGALLEAAWPIERSTVALVRTLVPQSSVQAPATVETRWLMQALALPEVVPAETQLARPPRAHVRWPELR